MHTSGRVDDSFEQWYRGHAPRLTATLTRASGDLGLAEEAVSEAAAKALLRWKKVGAMPDPSAWVYRVALNELRRRHRKHRREDEVLAGVTRPQASNEPNVDIWETVAALPERMRLVIALRYLGDLTEVQIADAMGISRGGVSSLLVKAHARLATDPSVRDQEDSNGRA
jgi:RNA polymerase sigma-70 factor (ECF subfamily)